MSNLKTEHEIEIDQIHDRQLAQKDAEIDAIKQAHATALKTQLVLNAEIERLKDQISKLSKSLNAQDVELDKKDQLITELCDALVIESPAFDVDYSNLVKRAREAAR